MADASEWRGEERRASLRIRTVIDDLRAELRDSRDAVEFLRDRVHALSVELEELRRAHNEGRPAPERTRTAVPG